MPLSLALLFHFDQPLSESALTASRVGYRGLLRVLCAHPRLKFNLQLSGSLIHALRWLDPEALDVVRAGVADGQFELVAGPYAGHELCATDDWDIAKQIALQAATLQAAFDVPAAGFWNPGRGWRQSLAPLVTGAGHSLMPVEDHLLHAAGAQDPVVFTTRPAGRSLTLLYDDSILRARVNYAAWTGRNRQVFDYLKRVAQRRGSSRFCLVYAERAGAMGLWGWQAGLAPQPVWANLDAFLTDLERQRWLKVVRLSDAPQPSLELDHIPDGTGAELERALADPTAPGHEPGFADWNDFIARAPKNVRFIGLYDSLRTRIRRITGDENRPVVVPDAAAEAVEAEYTQPQATRSPLLQQAVHVLCAYQHGFGYPGVGGPGYRGWEGVRSAFVLIRAAELATKVRTGLWVEDANGDGADEVLLCDGRQLAVISPAGARLLYWFDLVEGRQSVGNQLAVTAAPFKGDSPAPQFEPRPAEWWPDSDSFDLRSVRRLKIAEAPPTRLGKYLPDWVWDTTRPATLYERPVVPGAQAQPLRAGQRAFNDVLVLDGGEPFVPGLGDYRIEGDTAVFARFPAADFALLKRFGLAEGGLLVQYRLENRADSPRTVELTVACELCPDYAEVLNGGRSALEYVLVDDVNPGVRNTRTGRSVVLAASRPWQRLGQSEGLFALELALTFELTLAPQTAQTFDLKLYPLRFQLGKGERV